MYVIRHYTAKHCRWILFLLLALSASVQAQVTTPTEWGAVAHGSHTDCGDDTCPLYFLNLFVEEGNGGVNIPGASYSLTNSRGTINSSVTINGGLSVPHLTVIANSNSNSFIQAEATGVQGYTYTAASTGTITLAATLTGNITNPDSDDATGLTAKICLVPESGAFFFTGATFDCLTSSVSPSTIQMIVTSSGAVNQSQNVEIDLAPGDGFYVVAVIAAAAAGDSAIADAANTLTMAFTIANPGSDPDPAMSLTPAYSEAVNVPMLPLAASLALFLFIILLAKNQYRLNF